MNIKHQDFKIPIGNSFLKLGNEPTIMGILNVTPDSFSDGGKFTNVNTALKQAKKMIKHGAKIIDIGGESTRPNATKTPEQEELDRVIPIIKALNKAKLNTFISIDTYKANVADKALQSGAHIINDVCGLQNEPEMANVAANHNAPIIIMHWDKKRDISRDIIEEMKRFFEKSLTIAKDAGIKTEKIILDPGFGFAKTLKENYEILRRFDELQTLGFALLNGTSNKSMIGNLLDIPTKKRLSGTIATNIIAYNKGAHIFRVHNVKENSYALKVTQATNTNI